MLKSISYVGLILAIVILTGCSNTQQLLKNYSEVPRMDIEGYLLDRNTGDAISGIWVQVKETTVNARSDSSGRFVLNEIPSGRYDVLFSGNRYRDTLIALDLIRNPVENPITIELAPGFGSLADRRASSNGELESLIRQITVHQNRIIDLKKQVYNLADNQPVNGGTTNGQHSDNRLDLLKKYVIGSGRIEGCELLNAEDLEFTEGSHSSTVLRLQTPTTLKVMNRHLGYYITLYVDYLELRKDQLGYNIAYRGDPYFYEIHPDNHREIPDVIKNRNNAFSGSLKHFLIASSQSNPLYRYGFKLYKGQFLETATSLGSSFSKVRDVDLNKGEVISSTDNPQLYKMEFNGEMRIAYTFNRVNNRGEYSGVRKGYFPESWIRLKESPVFFTSNGSLLDKEKIMVTGYWNAATVCEMLPENYLPDFWR